MPLFFLHVLDRGRLIKDPDGTELQTVEEARREAILSAREIAATALITGAGLPLIEFLVTDQEGNRLLTVPCSDAFVSDGFLNDGMIRRH